MATRNDPDSLLVIQPVLDDADDFNNDAAKAIWSEGYNRFNQHWLVEQEERMQALQDRRFVTIAGAQYEGPWGQLFGNSVTVEINKTAQGVDTIERQYKQNRYTVQFRPVDQPDDNEAANTLNGMYRADFYLSKGQQALDNAFTEAVQGGYGAFRLTNVYCDDCDEDDDKQKIVWETIVDADQNVYWDLNAKLADKSDAAYCFVISHLTKEAFADRFGADKMTSWPEKFLKPFYDWYTPELVRVAEYYKLVEKPDTVYKLTLGVDPSQTMKIYKSDEDYKAKLRDAKVRGYAVTMTKDIKRKECRKWILSGQQCLSDPEGKLIAGAIIPVIPVYGKRSYIDNLERCRGHVRLAKDPQRVYNTQISKLVENAAQTPFEVPILTAEQISGHENEWAEANLNRAAYRVINTIIDESTGQKVVAGPVGTLSPPQLPPVMSELIQLTSNDIQELTNSQDGAGQVKANVSSEAMDIAATRTDDKAALYLDNMMQAVQRSGEIYQAMAQDIYFEDDRSVTTLDYNKKQQPVFKSATINTRGVDANGDQVTKNAIAKGQYHIIADVTDATNLKRDKTVKVLSNAIQIVAPSDPKLGAILTAAMVINMDGEGMEDIQSYLHNQLVQEGVIKPTPEEAAELQKQQELAAQQGPSPEDQLVLSTAKRQETLAEKDLADAEQAKSKTLVNQAQADKLHAETTGKHVENLQQIHAPIPVSSVKPEQKQQVVAPKSNIFSSLFGKK
jgi:hypothetical protein